MNVNSAMQNQINSVRQALSTSALQKSMGQDGTTVNKLLEGMEETTEAVQEAAGAHRGNNIDVKV
ncbi:MAG: putative motility protein [Bacillota bacterium]